MNWKETLNPYMSTEEATFYRRFLHILKHFLIVIVGGAFFTRYLCRKIIIVFCPALSIGAAFIIIRTAPPSRIARQGKSAPQSQSTQHPSSSVPHSIAHCRSAARAPRTPNRRRHSYPHRSLGAFAP